MTKKVFSIDTLPSVQRDGTFFDKNYYSDGRWVRFQRGRPRKILGFRSISNKLTGISRGIFVNSEDGVNTIFSGHESGLQTLTVDNNGVGSGLVDFEFDLPVVELAFTQLFAKLLSCGRLGSINTFLAELATEPAT